MKQVNWMRELGVVELIDGKLYSFPYSDNSTGAPIKGCRHREEGGIFYGLFDGNEDQVACVVACSRCGRVLEPRRMVMGEGMKAIKLGTQGEAFRSLQKFIAAH